MATIGQSLPNPETGWVRYDDNLANKFIYTGSWTVNTTDTGYFNSTAHITSTIGNTIKFRFKGTSLRIITSYGANRSNNIQINIDNNINESFSVNNSTTTYRNLSYEKLNLSDNFHEVTITNNSTNTNTTLGFDAIDINDGGYMPYRVGDQLLFPEAGWNRADDVYLKISGSGWIRETNTNYYASTDSYTNGLNSSYSFSFIGTGLRLIDVFASNRSQSVEIDIDGNKETFSNYASSTGSFQSIIYEKLNLSNTKHTVTVTNKDSSTARYLVIDAVDVLGYFVTYTIKDRITLPEAGWRRYDDAYEYIVYDPNWYVSNTSNAFNGSAHYIDSNQSGFASFKFYGSALRIIADFDTTHSSNAKIFIDGIEYLLNENNSTYISQSIVFEIFQLSLGIHEVKISSGTNFSNVAIDAIDINNDGKLIASVGSTITKVEDGWKRYDDLELEGNFTKNTNSSYYNSTFISSNQSGNVAYFDFMGKNLRIIGSIGTVNSNNITVTIDGVNYSFSENYSSTNYQKLVFEKTDLSYGRHLVTITTNDSSIVNIDAIDIDYNGRLLRRKEVINIFDADIGNVIRTNYKSISGSVGGFIKINKGYEPLLNPTTLSANPSGDLYFNVVDKIGNNLTLIADRNIQSNITYNTINSAIGNGLALINQLYVDSVNGLDTNDGSENTPYKSITTAISAATQGTIIKLSSGIFTIAGLHLMATLKNLTFIGNGINTILEVTTTTANYVPNVGSTGYFQNMIIRPSNSLGGDNRFIWYNNNAGAQNFKLRFNNVLFTKSLNNTYPGRSFFIWSDNVNIITNPNVLFENCSMSTTSNVQFEEYASLSTIRYINCVNSNRFNSTNITTINCLTGVIYDVNYNIINTNWKNLGVGFNIDKSIANLGIYGGDNQWGAYTFKKNPNIYTSQFLSGGTSISDTSNDWYNYIVNSNLNNTIIAGNNNTWNWMGFYSLTNTQSSGNGVVRGNTAKDGFSTISNTTTSNYRPKMNIVVNEGYLNDKIDLPATIKTPFQRVSDLNSTLFIPPKGSMTMKANITPLSKSSLPSMININSIKDLPSFIEVPLHGTMTMKANIVQPPRMTVNLNPIQDAFITTYAPRLNYGSTGDLLVGNSASGNVGIYRSLLKFDLSSIGTEMITTKGILKLYFDYDNMIDLNISLNNVNQDWTEMGVTWANQPTADQEITQFLVGSQRGYISVDITNLVSQWQKATIENDGVLLKSVDETLTEIRRFYSRETTQYKPILEVEYYDPTPKSYDYGEIDSVIRIQRSNTKDLNSILRVKALFENGDLPSSIHLTNLNRMIEASLNVTRDNLRSTIKIRRSSNNDLNSNITIAQKSLSDLEGSININPVYLSGKIRVRQKDYSDLSSQITIIKKDKIELPSFININSPNLQGKVDVVKSSNLDASIMIKYARNSNLSSSIKVIQNKDSDLQSMINIVDKSLLSAFVNVNSGYLASSLTVPFKEFKDLSTRMNIRVFYADDLFSKLVVGKVIDLPAHMEIILGRPNNFVIYF